MPQSIQLIISALLTTLILAACATISPEFSQGKYLLDEGKVDEGLSVLDKLTQKDPTNVEYRTYYFDHREMAVNALLVKADGARRAERNDDAASIYRHILEIDKSNMRAKVGLAELDQEKHHALLLNQSVAIYKSGQTADAIEKLHLILEENPHHPGAMKLLNEIKQKGQQEIQSNTLLNTKFKKPITLEFREAPIKSIFEVLSQSSDINFIFEPDVRADLRASITVRNTTLDDVLGILLSTYHLEKKILNDNTILIYSATVEKKREFQELVTKSFYLSNAESKNVASMIKTMVKSKDLFVDEKLNLVIVRDTPEAVHFAEQLVNMVDKFEPEVMLEVEVMEITRNRLTNLGINWPASVSYGLKGAAGVAGSATLAELHNGGAKLVSLTLPDPAVVLNLLQQDSDTNLLANPRIRVKNHEKAKIHVGDRVPEFTSTSSAAGFVTQSVNYLDVGLKLDVEPTIYLGGDVGIKIGLEVSSILNTVSGGANSTATAYQIGTRNADTVLRLHDGETQILGGLINKGDINSANKIPSLGDFPILGKLFSSQSDTKNKTEIVMLITPHVIRNIMRPDSDETKFLSGTEISVGQVQKANESPVIRGVAPTDNNAKNHPSVQQLSFPR